MKTDGSDGSLDDADPLEQVVAVRERRYALLVGHHEREELLLQPLAHRVLVARHRRHVLVELAARCRLLLVAARVVCIGHFVFRYLKRQLFTIYFIILSFNF